MGQDPANVSGTELAGRSWPLNRGPSPLLLLPLLLAALIDIGIVARSPNIARDGVTFIQLAQDLATDALKTLRNADQHPGYPVLILASRWMAAAGDAGNPEGWIAAARIAPAICGLLVVPMVFLFAKRIFNTPVAVVTAYLCAALPSFRQNAADALSDTPHLLIYLLSAYLALEGLQRRQWIWFAGAGAAGGLAYWIRPEGLGVVAGAALALILAVLLRSGIKRPTAFRCLLALMLSTLLIAAPYAAWSGKITGKKNISKLALDTECRRLASGSPFRVLGQGLLELVKETGTAFFVLLLIPLAAGLFAARGQRGGREAALLAAAAVSVHISLVLFLYYSACYISHRHLLPVVALLLPWVGSGTLVLVDTMQARFFSASGARAEKIRRRLRLITVSVMIAAMLPQSLRPLHAQTAPLVELARRLKSRASAGDRVLSNSAYVPFFSGLPGRVLEASEGLPELAAAMGRLPYQFVVLEVGSSNFNPRWLAELDAYYQESESRLLDGNKRRLVLMKPR